MEIFADKRRFGPTPRYDLVKAYEPKDSSFVIVSGSCSVESPEQVHEIAGIVAKLGATHLRGGVFRAGTYPGKTLGWVDEELISAYRSAAVRNGLKNIIEVLEYSEKSLDMIAPLCDVFQVGARSQQNYSLLKILGRYNKPVFLKRNTGCTVDEWLGSAEHLLNAGVKELYLIERGSSTFHNDVRWTPCLHTIPSVKSICKIPVIMDASHGSGRRDLVEPLTLAGVAAGAAGVLIECHKDPEKSMSDAEQAVSPETLESIINKVNKIRKVLSE